MKKLKGPELKMPELKAPPFLADLYYDLRDRRLLPLIALVVVAIAAVPFLLGGEVERPILPAAGAAMLGSPTEKTSTLTVVEATPGLRDYRKRLRRRSPTDPFKQLYTEPAGGPASSSPGEGTPASASPASSAFSEESVTAESTTAEVESGGSSNGGSSKGGASPNGSGGSPPSSAQGARLFEFVLDVQIVHTEATPDGGQKMSEPEVRRRVHSLTQLPGKKTPVVTTMGPNLHTGKIVWLVSNDVESLDGEFNCVSRTPTGACELLEIEPGFPLELVYGPDKVLYRIKVTNIDTVWAGKVGDSRSSSGDIAVPTHAALSTP
ncbi:MAG TPA: hypothetical protein VLK56_00355 [Solirubrobacterales bacterium]|nr:hypothetical protein [Solirubrobacterales bacterium]